MEKRIENDMETGIATEVTGTNIARNLFWFPSVGMGPECVWTFWNTSLAGGQSARQCLGWCMLGANSAGTCRVMLALDKNQVQAAITRPCSL